MAALAGFNGRVKISLVGSSLASGQALPATRWQITWKVDALDVTTFEATAGTALTPVSQWLPGITDFDLSFDVLWDTTLNVFSTFPPGLEAGNYVQIELDLLKGTTADWVFPNVLLIDVVQDAEVRGVIKYSITGRQSGGPPNTVFPIN